jgi:hypothetical protein
MKTVYLEESWLRWHTGYDVWGADGRFRLHVVWRHHVFRKRGAYFRDCRAGKVYRVISSNKTVEIEPQFLSAEARKAVNF